MNKPNLPYIFISKSNNYPYEEPNLLEYSFNLQDDGSYSSFYEDYLYLIVGNLKGREIILQVENESLPGSSLLVSKLDNSLNVIEWTKKLTFNVDENEKIYVFKYKYEVINNRYIIANNLTQVSFLNCYVVTNDYEKLKFVKLLKIPDLGSNHFRINENDMKEILINNYDSSLNYEAVSNKPHLLKADIISNKLILRSTEVDEDENVEVTIKVYNSVDFPNLINITVNIICLKYHYNSDLENNDDVNNIYYIIESKAVDSIYEAKNNENDTENNILTISENPQYDITYEDGSNNEINDIE